MQNSINVWETIPMAWKQRFVRPRVRPPKSLSSIEVLQIVFGIIVSVSTVIIGWKTFELNDRATESTAQLKNIEQQLAENKFGFERIRDIYDRTEKYLSSEKQDERRGRALVVLIGSLPDSTLRTDLLSIVVREASSPIVAATAADTQRGKGPSPIPNEIKPTLGPGFFGNISFRRKDDEGFSVMTQETFGFKDSKGVVWQVPAGYVFDGASVPRLFWSIVGPPLSSDLIASYVLLDYYNTNRKRSPETVIQMFYESLLISGVSEFRAKMLSNSLQAFGPKWVVTEPQ
jgi:hypothetical protein